MANAKRGADILDSERARHSIQTIAASDVDWKSYEMRQERARVIPAENLAEEGKRLMLIGAGEERGLALPWRKASGKVLIKSGKLVIWSGWQHHGKSNMAKQVMLHAMAEGERVGIASMEEEICDIWGEMGRMACGCAEPSVREIDRWIAFQTGRLWFYDQQGMVGAAQIRAVVRYCAEELGIRHFVIDSLMMLAVDRDDYDAQSRFVSELKTEAKDTQCTIHLITHMRKREGSRGEDQPGSAHDIAGGHEIASKADLIFNVWRDKSKKIANTPDCVLSVEKQRGRINWIGKLALNFHPGSRQYIEESHPTAFLPQRQREPGEDDQ